ncbi:hypothetical protein [Campylobacter hominis]|uniref:Uncharacterized protein n=1 Tax=Campylobacter hominis (strain ATCC BAA-381 / DSM 21671 / CCUG 45161 / LMG 19568 / NCTC 13146 / CH001A) TaxID=360107 RepID=A7I0H2_CAMHC|nr:hypothetical protein [Campylobacter hominis]ABS51923.1 hypothetical protein CHAB381_0415 [Campylobacter hominis ATCC BAA-381]SUW84560.1 Uncharacterised protein [Campylobacter hominis]
MQELKIKITTDANGAINAIEQTKKRLFFKAAKELLNFSFH